MSVSNGKAMLVRNDVHGGNGQSAAALKPCTPFQLVLGTVLFGPVAGGVMAIVAYAAMGKRLGGLVFLLTGMAFALAAPIVIRMHPPIIPCMQWLMPAVFAVAYQFVYRSDFQAWQERWRGVPVRMSGGVLVILCLVGLALNFGVALVGLALASHK